MDREWIRRLRKRPEIGLRSTLAGNGAQNLIPFASVFLLRLSAQLLQTTLEQTKHTFSCDLNKLKQWVARWDTYASQQARHLIGMEKEQIKENCFSVSESIAPDVSGSPRLQIHPRPFRKREAGVQDAVG